VTCVSWSLEPISQILLNDRGRGLLDGVHIAARLEALAEPGGISVSGRVQEDAHGTMALGSFSSGGLLTSYGWDVVL
jgi:hypothetical protein